MIDVKAFKEINKIIERDATSSTYKFILLKNTIEICQKFEHLIKISDKLVYLPLGLLVEGWIFDYLPFVFKRISQQPKYKVLNTPIENEYENLFKSMNLDRNKTIWQDAYVNIYNAYHNLEFNKKQVFIFGNLARLTAKTIVNMPMRYIGSMPYTIFIPEKKSFGRGSFSNVKIIHRGILISGFGYFGLPKEYYYVFRYFGQSLYGTSTIIRRWKEKTYKYNKKNIIKDEIDSMILKSEVREVESVKKLLFANIDIQCVWSGEILKNRKYDIDHILPFSIWQNNDFWNLLPSSPKINNKKRDKIPPPQLIKKRAEAILYYWQIYEKQIPEVFWYQIKTSLVGNSKISISLNDCIDALCMKADYLIRDRGFDIFDF